MSTSSYDDLMIRRVTWHDSSGFEPVILHDWLFNFQKSLVEYAVRKGRAAIFADCGLGKTAMQLSWADNVARKCNGKVILVTPLAVAKQTERESVKFGIDAEVRRDGSASNSGITITNYENLHKFQPHDFVGIVCDESSAIKNFDGKRKQIVTEFCRTLDYRLLCTATAAPNDYHELGTSSEALGYLGYRDMLTTFFKLVQGDGGLGWGRSKYRFLGHAERPFWRWVVSWSRAIRKPSDLGFIDDGYCLPPLIEREHIIEDSTPRQGLLFSVPARGLREEREERRATISERCERVAEMSKGSDPVVVWCHLNDEGDLLEKLIPDAVQVKGSMRDDDKEQLLHGFSDGEYRVLVTKPKIGCWGLNWQHCNRVITFPSHSFEQYYQAVRRCWRFGQKRQVHVDVVSTMGEAGVLANLRDKQEKTEKMFEGLVSCMNREIALEARHDFNSGEVVPSWL